MKFTDLLRAGVLLSGSAATALGAGCVAIGQSQNEAQIVLFSTVWWVVAALTGLMLGRSNRPAPSVARLLADARTQRDIPEPQVGRIVAGRLWPLAVLVLAALVGAAAFGAQVAGVGAGFLILWAMIWRKQEFAVRAVETRDGVVFYVKPVGPFTPLQLVRGPGLRRESDPRAAAGRS
jgi:hypothetical protein